MSALEPVNSIQILPMFTIGTSWHDADAPPENYGVDKSEPVWLRVQESPKPGEAQGRVYFVLGRAEWETIGTPTYPDAERGVEDPICVMQWSPGKHFYTDVFRKQRVPATHWIECECPEFPAAAPVQAYNSGGSANIFIVPETA